MDSRYMLGVIALAFALLLVPDGSAEVAITLGVHASTPFVVWYGVRRFRPPARGPWALLGGGMATMFAGDVVGVVGFGLVRDVVHVVAYVLIVAAAVTMLRIRGAGQDRDGLLDALIFGSGAAILIWHFVVGPEMQAATTMSERWFAAAYPLFDVVLFALIVRLVLSPGARGPSLWYIIGGLAVGLVVDVAGVTGSTAPLLDVASVLTRALAAAAALSPSMLELTNPDVTERRHVQRLRLLALGGCLILFSAFFAVDQMQTAMPRAEFVIGPPVFAVLMMLRLVSVIRDHERALQQLSTQALHDALTGLPNRRLVTDRITMALARGTRRSGTVAVLFCDLDGFKFVNDRFGHSTGDEMLCLVADRLRSVLRPEDTLGRLGGDEFLVCCENLTSPAAARVIAERITQALVAPFVLSGGRRAAVSASVGIAIAGPDASADLLLRDADTAMYAAKDRGKDRVEVFNPAMRTRFDEREARRVLDDAAREPQPTSTSS